MARVIGEIIRIEEVEQGDKLAVMDGPHIGWVFRVIYPPLKQVQRDLRPIVRLHGGLVQGGGYFFEGPPDREVRLLAEFPTTNRSLINIKLQDDFAEMFRNA